MRGEIPPPPTQPQRSLMGLECPAQMAQGIPIPPEEQETMQVPERTIKLKRIRPFQ